MDFGWALYMWYLDYTCDLDYVFYMILDEAFLVKSNIAMATRINITKIANFDIHDESNLARQWKKWIQSFEFYLSASVTDDDSQMKALLRHCVGPDTQDILIHLDADATYKAAVDAFNNHFEPKKNVAFVTTFKGQTSR